MDSGWAVVVGAAIGLLGSAVVPWARDAVADRRRRDDEAETRRRNAITDLLTANSAIGFAVIASEKAALVAAFERRSRAAAALLLELKDPTRRIIRELLHEALPVKGEDGTSAGHRIRALQHVLTDWATGDLKADYVGPTYASLLAQYKRKPRRDPEGVHAPTS